MEDSLKLLFVNIEGDTHLKRVVPFVLEKKPDVLCMQEVLEKDVPLFKETFKMDGLFVPSIYIKNPNTVNLTPGTNLGGLLLTNLPIQNKDHTTYVQDGSGIPVFSQENASGGNKTIISATVTKNNTDFRVITAHFTWSPNGEASPIQKEHIGKLLSALEQYDEFVLCGDFNAPRGKEIWEKIAGKYKDNIPLEITTTMDQNLHKVKGLEYVVDGIFTTPQYRAHNVQVIDGVSDHMALYAEISSLVK